MPFDFAQGAIAIGFFLILAHPSPSIANPFQSCLWYALRLRSGRDRDRAFPYFGSSYSIDRQFFCILFVVCPSTSLRARLRSGFCLFWLILLHRSPILLHPVCGMPFDFAQGAIAIGFLLILAHPTPSIANSFASCLWYALRLRSGRDCDRAFPDFGSSYSIDRQSFSILFMVCPSTSLRARSRSCFP